MELFSDMPKRDFKRSVLVTIFLILLTWITLAEAVFPFRHPELTDTQRLLHTWDALMFR